MKNYHLKFAEKDRNNFEEVSLGLKSVETRAATVKYRPIEVGDTLTFVCGKDKLVKTVTKKYHWKNIDEMVKEIPFQQIMPSIESVEGIKKVYSSYPNYDQKIKEFGIFGWEIK